MSALQHVPLHSKRMSDLVAKHRAFWRHQPEGVIQAVNVFAPSAKVRLPQPDGSVITHAERLTPDMIHPAEMIREVLAWDPAVEHPLLAAKEQVLAYPGVGELMPFSRPFFKIPWLEAMIGCPITMTEGQIWVERYPGDPIELLQRRAPFQHNPWLSLYVEFLQQIQSLAPTYLPSANTLFRGPSDLVAAILGVKEACVGWYDAPQLMARLLRLGADANLAAIEAATSALKPVAGGYMSGYGLWSPTPIVRVQADHSSLLSPALYEHHILPYDREVIAACPTSMFHIHNNGYHIAPLLVQIDELDAIEVVVDPYPRGTRKAHEEQMMRMIQQHKPLMVDANLPSYDEARRLFDCLEPRGLYFNMQFDPEILTTLPADLPHSQVWLIEP